MEFVEREPIYLQISAHVAEQILARLWKAGDRIPSVRDLAVTMEVNPNTVSRTYLSLQERGIIENRRGIGYFIAEGAHQQVLQELRARVERDELPKLFRTLQLLSMEPEELAGLYRAYRNNHNKVAS